MRKRKNEEGAKVAGIDAKAVMGKVEKIVSEKGFRLRPSAGLTVKNYCKKAVEKGVIKNVEEAITVTLALVAGGAHHAISSGAKLMNVEDINRGWEKISVGPVGCPPYFCSRHSILDRREELKDELEEFREFEAIRGKSD